MILKAKKATLWFTKGIDSTRTIWLEKPTFSKKFDSWGGSADFLHVGTERAEELFDNFAPNLEAGEEGVKKVTLLSQEDL